MSNATITCSFCSKIIPTKDIVNNEDYVFIGGDSSVCICKNCIASASRRIEKFSKKNSFLKNTNITPMTIKAKLDEWIIDQELAKKRMSIAVYDHFKRINQDPNEDDVIEKSNMILVGSTGSGKTAIVKALSKQLQLPLHIDDITTVSTTGYQGRNVEDILSGLLSKANGDIELAQKGIILLDEGDKMKKQDDGRGSRDVKGVGVQQALLKITEGGEFDVKYERRTYKFNTSNVLFIIAGAFEGLEELISKRQNIKIKTSGGFTGDITTKQSLNYNKLIMDVKHEDLFDYGMMPELLGRFPIITPLQELSEAALVKILTEPKNAIIKQMKKSFDMDEIELDFDTDALKTIADKAKRRKIGARGLRAIVEEALEKPKFECPGSNIKRVVIRKDLSCEFDIEN